MARISPNGRRVVFVSDDGKDGIVWIYELSGTSSMRRLTFSGKNRLPIWSGDGQYVAFQSDREGDLGIFRQRADGTGPVERLTKADPQTAHVPESWSPTSDQFLYSVDAGTHSLWTFSIKDVGMPVRLPRGSIVFGGTSTFRPVDMAPDGRIIGPIDATQSQPGMSNNQFNVILNWTEELKATVPAIN